MSHGTLRKHRTGKGGKERVARKGSRGSAHAYNRAKENRAVRRKARRYWI